MIGSRTRAVAFFALSLFGGARLAPALSSNDVYEADVAFALDELEQRCRDLLNQKDVDWRKVRREFEKEARSVEDDGQHLALMIRLLARLQDGHAAVRPGPSGKEVRLPEDWLVERRGPGFFLCKVGRRYHVKNAWGEAQELGIEPGVEVLKIDGVATSKWVEARVEELRDRVGFSTGQQALFYATHWGLSYPEGTRLKLELKDLDRKKRKRTVTCVEKSRIPDGPAFPVPGLEVAGDSVRYATLAGGTGYVHVRRVKDEVLAELDAALAALAEAPGLILDFRGNSGGGCDHDAFEARFVPLEREMPRMARPPLPGAGPRPYAGPVIVIIDATVRSAGETLSGMFGEDGRAYTIGESATAGMSSQKETVDLPSGLFTLYFSVRSNRSSFNGGRGIEGIGVAPHETLEYEPEELAEGVDTMLRRACELLEDYPQKEVEYDPADYGWGG
jgi:C-terminal processing protease CtpA/Prc